MGSELGIASRCVLRQSFVFNWRHQGLGPSEEKEILEGFLEEGKDLGREAFQDRGQSPG